MTDLREEWWKRWWAADWSWQGLASKVVAEVGCAPSTLQDRWRMLQGAPTSEEELERQGQLVRDSEGRLWHIAHVPQAWLDGAATWKVNTADERWHALAALIQGRIAEGASTNGSPKGTDAQADTTRYRRLPSGAERRAVLGGCVLSGFCIPQSSEDWMHVKATGAAFLTSVVCQDARLGAGFTLEDCLFDDALELSLCFSTDMDSRGIQPGTAIVTWIKRAKAPTTPAATQVHYREFWGPAARKREALIASLPSGEAVVPGDAPAYEDIHPSAEGRWRLSPRVLEGGFDA